MKVAFLGPEGTFSQQALEATIYFDAERLSCSTIYDAVHAVQSQAADRAFVPIENSIEGSVNATLDALAFDAPDVCIAREITYPIRHRLIAARQLGLDEITRVITHPHARAQCARFLRERLGHAKLVATNSTAEAVQFVSQSKQPWAALGTELSAEIYNCQVLLDEIEDHEDNRTRFVYLSYQQADASEAPAGAPWKTSIVCGIGDDHPGALLEILEQFASREINLTKIESRPAKTGLGAYVFFIDMEGSASDNRTSEALTALGQSLQRLRVLGSYPTLDSG